MQPVPAGRLLPLTRHALGDEVYATLRGMIFRGTLEPGARITETSIAQLLGVSRTPVREAFQRLEYDGLLTTRTGHSARVTILTADDINEIYPVIAVLEGVAARLAGPRLTEDDLRRMMDLTGEMQRCGRRGDIENLLKADNEFHGLLHTRANNRHLKRVVRDLRDQMDRFEYAFFAKPAMQRASVKRHRKLVRILRSGRFDLAEKTLQKQWDLGREALLEIVRQGKLGKLGAVEAAERKTGGQKDVKAGRRTARSFVQEIGAGASNSISRVRRV